MAWEWIVLLIVSVVGPTLFSRFAPTRQETTVRGGAVFTINYSPVTLVLRSAVKFGAYWGIALLLARLDNRLWLRLWAVGLPLLGTVAHFVLVKRNRIHWLTGKPL